MPGLGRREIEGAVGVQRLSELVAAWPLPSRSAGDEREVLVRVRLVAECRQLEVERRLELPRSRVVVAVLVALDAALELLLGTAFLAAEMNKNSNY